jgi:sarcosine oxidase
MGSQIALALQRRGLSVLGLDQHHPPHAFGSSHGHTRIIREAYFEHPLYVPIVQRAYELWEVLERQSGRRLVSYTGGLMVGPRDGTLITGALRSAVEHDLPHEPLTAGQVRTRWPAFEMPADFAAVYEPRAGVLAAEQAIAATISLARAAGATLRVGERVVCWRSTADKVEVQTTNGHYVADHLVLAAGPWTNDLIRLPIRLTVARQPLLWFEPPVGTDPLDLHRLPVFIWELETGEMFYGFPRDEHGLKVARHHHGQPTTPESVERGISDEDERAVRRFLGRALPATNGKRLHGAICMYTNTADGHFVIDRLPTDQNVIVVSACSGHGFKFAPAIGEAVAELIVDGSSRLDLTPFALETRRTPKDRSAIMSRLRRR